MITVAEAMEKIAALLSPVETEEVALAHAGGRILRAPAVATRNQPPFSASAMDGYAVRAADLATGARLQVIGEVPAGKMPDMLVGPGQAVRIFTGAPLPDGADHILIQEDTDRDGDRITVRDGRDTAPYIRHAGADFAAGFELGAGRRLSSGDVALLASMNVPRVTVSRRPVVAIIPTGDELVWPGETPRPDQIVASNNFGLKAMLAAAGADVRLLPIAPDRPDALAAVFERARGADLIVTLGGASVGDYDLVQSVAGERGLDLSFYKLAMRPGKPLMAGKLGDATMIGLPGNPVSSMVCGQIFVRPAVDALQGLRYAHPEIMQARLTCDIGQNGNRAHYMRATVTHDNGAMTCTPATRQDSALLTVLSTANALMIRPAGDPARSAGDTVDYCLI